MLSINWAKKWQFRREKLDWWCAGLDPAWPEFSEKDIDSRLDETDAHFVDVIHTKSGHIYEGGLSFLPAIGHVDFYPNGGKQQIGCRNQQVDPAEGNRRELDGSPNSIVILWVFDADFIYDDFVVFFLNLDVQCWNYLITFIRIYLILFEFYKFYKFYSNALILLLWFEFITSQFIT